MPSVMRVLKEKNLLFPRTKVVSDSHRFLGWGGVGKFHTFRSHLAWPTSQEPQKGRH